MKCWPGMCSWWSLEWAADREGVSRARSECRERTRERRTGKPRRKRKVREFRRGSSPAGPCPRSSGPSGTCSSCCESSSSGSSTGNTGGGESARHNRGTWSAPDRQEFLKPFAAPAINHYYLEYFSWLILEVENTKKTILFTYNKI